MFQASKYVVDFTRKKAIQSARSLVEYQDEDVRGRIEEILSAEDAGKMKLQQSIESSAVFVLRILLVVAVIYALVGPFLSGISYRVSIHRALMIMLAASPVSVCISFPVVAISGLCFSGRNGVLFKARIKQKIPNLFRFPGQIQWDSVRYSIGLLLLIILVNQ